MLTLALMIHGLMVDERDKIVAELVKRGDFDEARKILEQNTESAVQLYNLGMVQMHAGNFAEAIQIFQASNYYNLEMNEQKSLSPKIDDLSVLMMLNEGLAYAALRAHDSALQCLFHALSYVVKGELASGGLSLQLVTRLAMEKYCEKTNIRKSSQQPPSLATTCTDDESNDVTLNLERKEKEEYDSPVTADVQNYILVGEEDDDPLSLREHCMPGLRDFGEHGDSTAQSEHYIHYLRDSSFPTRVSSCGSIDSSNAIGQSEKGFCIRDDGLVMASDNVEYNSDSDDSSTKKINFDRCDNIDGSPTSLLDGFSTSQKTKKLFPSCIIIQILLNIGCVYCDMGKMNVSFSTLLEALTHAKNLARKLEKEMCHENESLEQKRVKDNYDFLQGCLSIAAMNIGYVQIRQRKFTEAKQSLIEALSLFKSILGKKNDFSGNLSDGIFFSCIHDSACLGEADEFSGLLLEMDVKSLKREASEWLSRLEIVTGLIRIGFAWTIEGRYTEAIKVIDKVLLLNEEESCADERGRVLIPSQLNVLRVLQIQLTQRMEPLTTEKDDLIVPFFYDEDMDMSQCFETSICPLVLARGLHHNIHIIGPEFIEHSLYFSFWQDQEAGLLLIGSVQNVGVATSGHDF